MGVGGYRREEEGAVEGEREDVVEEIEIILCGFVIGSPICALAVGVVSATILVDIVRYR